MAMAAIGQELSLTARLLRRIILPMVIVAIVAGVGGAWMINRTVEVVNDRILGAASRAIADSLASEDGVIALNLSPAIFGMLEDTERDNVYYSVRKSGVLLTGYGDLPDIVPQGLRDTEVVFGDAVYKGQPVRVVAEGRALPQIDRPVVIEVAETLSTRKRESRRELLALAFLEVLLVLLAAILLPVAVRRGMRPLLSLSDDMNRRRSSDLTPLSTSDIATELRPLVLAFNGMLARLGATLDQMQRFTADASHQMRTPLSILRTHVELLRRSQSWNHEGQDSLDDIDLATTRLENLLTQLLALARADSAHEAGVDLEQVDLTSVVRQIAEDAAPRAVAAGMELHFDSPSRAVHVRTHRVFLAEVLANFVDNAIRYNRPGGSVALAIVERPAHVEVVVEDDGPGIPAADRAKVFDRFTRLPRDSKRPGSGLGLSIAARLARAIGTDIGLHEGISGRGLRVVVKISRVHVVERQVTG